MSLSEQLEQLADDIENGATAHSAAAYAGIPVTRGGTQAASKEGIIAAHFKRGNKAKYAWPPLAKEYAKRKRKQFPGRPMLVRTGALKESLLGHGVISKVSRGVFRLRWYNVPAYHKHLTTGGRNPIKPQGPDLPRIVKAAQQFIQSKIKALKRAKKKKTPRKAKPRAV